MSAARGQQDVPGRTRCAPCIALGQRAFGENYVQEALAKMDALADLAGLEWHLIGPLQGNKARAGGRSASTGCTRSTG